ncbi:MAG: 50S ribosomal protein L19 [Pseudomonadota bacterium]|nr:50S ribosomal protein L19 [Pseudomonadota bacterium]
MDIIEKLEKQYTEELSQGKEIPEFRAGDNIAVNVLIKEGSRERIQTFEGVCISRSGEGLNQNFTVRKISYGEGVERVFSFFSPLIESIKVIKKGKVRRSKLYYLRSRRGKSARIAERQDINLKKSDKEKNEESADLTEVPEEESAKEE